VEIVKTLLARIAEFHDFGSGAFNPYRKEMALEGGEDR